MRGVRRVIPSARIRSRLLIAPGLCRIIDTEMRLEDVVKKSLSLAIQLRVRNEMLPISRVVWCRRIPAASIGWCGIVIELSERRLGSGSEIKIGRIERR
jgi:hypothetical protein